MGTRTFAVAAVALVFALAGPAVAQPQGDWHEQCYGPDPTLEEIEGTSCVKHGNGNWQPVVESDPVESMFGTFAFFAILLSLVPAFAGVAVASSAGVAPGVGFAIGLFGSWIGVIGLYLYGHSQKRGTPAIRVGPAVERSAPEPSTAADRLRNLKELLDQGLITQEEYQARRRAAVDSL